MSHDRASSSPWTFLARHPLAAAFCAAMLLAACVRLARVEVPAAPQPEPGERPTAAAPIPWLLPRISGRRGLGV